MNSVTIRPAAIREAIVERGIKMAVASRVSGIPLRTLTRKLSGETELTVTDLHRLSRVLGCSTSTLWRMMTA